MLSFRLAECPIMHYPQCIAYDRIHLYRAATNVSSIHPERVAIKGPGLGPGAGPGPGPRTQSFEPLGLGRFLPRPLCSVTPRGIRVAIVVFVQGF